jgi:hypothetical protein
VTLVSSTIEKSDSVFQYLFPPHSLTVMKFDRAPDEEEGEDEGDQEEEPDAPPVISDLMVYHRDGTSVLISWRTDHPAGSEVRYGTVAGQLDQVVEDPSMVTEHELLLESLHPEMHYYYRVISRDAWDQEVTYQEGPFWMPDITGPAVELLEVASVSESTAVICWRTSEPADTRLRYGIDPELNEQLTLRALALQHEIVLADLQAATGYRFQVSGTDSAGNPGQISEGRFTTASPTSGLGDLAAGEGLPGEYGLSQNYPNPFNGSTTIRYRLAESGPVTVRVYNTRGQEVVTLADGYWSKGEHQLCWDARDGEGREVASGVYFCCLQTENSRWMTKMTLLR